MPAYPAVMAVLFIVHPPLSHRPPKAGSYCHNSSLWFAGKGHEKDCQPWGALPTLTLRSARVSCSAWHVTTTGDTRRITERHRRTPSIASPGLVLASAEPF